MTNVGLRVLPTEKLEPDPDVQLAFAFSERQGREIGLHYNEKLVGVLAVVSNGNGRYWVIDGRHRLFGAVIAGITEMRCDVLAGPLTPAEKAQIKLGRDKARRQVRAIEHFLVAVTAEDARAIEIKDIAERHGFEIGKCNAGKPYGRIEAVRALERIYDSHGAEVLSRSLALNTLWKDELKTNSGGWLLGLGFFAAKGYDQRLSGDGYKRLKDIIPAKLIREVVAESQVHSYGGGGHALGLRLAEKLRRKARIRPSRKKDSE